MLRGTQKKIIIVNEMQNRYFDSAYFILKADLPAKDGGDLLAEAQRLIGEYTPGGPSAPVSAGPCAVACLSGENPPAASAGEAGGRKKRRFNALTAYFLGAATVGLAAGIFALAARLFF